MYICLCVCAYYVCACIYICVCVYIYICVYICIVFIYIYISLYTYISNLSKLTAARQEERLQKWKEYFKNLFRNPPEITNKPTEEIIKG